jgi:hypothetical protein
MTMNMGTRKRVLVVGAGAAGMACADTLSAHPDKFDVTLIEAQVCTCRAPLKLYSTLFSLFRIIVGGKCSQSQLMRKSMERHFSTRAYRGMHRLWLKTSSIVLNIFYSGSHIYHHTFRMFDQQGLSAEPWVQPI